LKSWALACFRDVRSWNESDAVVDVAPGDRKERALLECVQEYGETVGKSWQAVLRDPDRYRSVAYEDVFAGVARTGDPVLADWTEYQRTRYGWDR